MVTNRASLSPQRHQNVLLAVSLVPLVNMGEMRYQGTKTGNGSRHFFCCWRCCRETIA